MLSKRKISSRYSVSIRLFNNRYILTMVDHFFKYGWIIVMFIKKAATIKTAIKLCLTTQGKPESFHTDNGLEFVDENFTTYRNNQKYSILTVHFTIHKAKELLRHITELLHFYLVKEMNGDHFELKVLIFDFSLSYDNRVHSITKFSSYKFMKTRSEK